MSCKNFSTNRNLSQKNHNFPVHGTVAMNLFLIPLTLALLSDLPSEAVAECTSGTWSEWSTPTCNDTCGLCGVMIQTRTCLSEASGTPCSGATTQEGVPCGSPVCQMPRSSCCTKFSKRALVSGKFVCIPLANATVAPPPTELPCPTTTETPCPDGTGMAKIFMTTEVQIGPGAYGYQIPSK